jgi:hypothetical protein
MEAMAMLAQKLTLDPRPRIEEQKRRIQKGKSRGSEQIWMGSIETGEASANDWLRR